MRLRLELVLPWSLLGAACATGAVAPPPPATSPAASAGQEAPPPPTPDESPPIPGAESSAMPRVRPERQDEVSGAAPRRNAAGAPPVGDRAGTEAMFRRELPPLPIRHIELPGAPVAGEVEGDAEPVISRRGSATLLSIPIGTRNPIECLVADLASARSDGSEPANRTVTFRTGAAIARTLAELRQRVDIKLIRNAGLEVLGETPALRLDVLYLARAAPGARSGGVGEAKLLIYPDDGVPLLCMHDEPGYGATFTRIAGGLARTLHVTERRPAPRFVDVQVTRVAGVPIGFEKRSVRGDHGATIDTAVQSLWVPRSPSEIQVTDSEVVEESDRAGRLIRVAFAEAIEGEESSRLLVNRLEHEPGYTYEGSLSGKQVRGTFVAPEAEGLPSALLVAREIKEVLLGGRRDELEVAEYHADVSPVQPIAVTYRRAAGALTAAFGNVRMHGTTDREGYFVNAEIQVPGTALAIERAFTRGHP